MKTTLANTFVQHAVHVLETTASKSEFRGYDPFDGLNSQMLTILPLPTKYAKIAWIQFFKRFPINLRPLFLIPKGINPKSMGLFLSGYMKLNEVIDEEKRQAQITYLLDWLKENASTGYSGACWGYNFDWQNRAFYLPKYTPTIVNSSFIGHAFLDAFAERNEQKLLEVARSIADFILNDLHISTFDFGLCFSYTPVDTTCVHNANMLGAGFLARLYQITQENNLLEKAEQAAAYTLNFQHENGGWYYAETQMQSWVDSFHTGFILRSLQHLENATKNKKYAVAIEKGLRFFLENFIRDDGCVKYYANTTYPIDIHAFAETLAVFAVFKNQFPQIDMLQGSVLRFLKKEMFSNKGFFYYRKEKWGRNRIHYMRWSTAWMFYGLAHTISTSRKT